MNGERRAIKDKAREVIAKHGITKPPVNVFTIAQNEGLNIIYFAPESETTQRFSGLYDKDERRIYVNINDSLERKAFTVAHELAHYFLQHRSNQYGVYLRDGFYETKKPAKEIEADVFAAELLMPRAFLDNFLKKYKLGRDDAYVLAGMFGVSRSAMQYRLKNFDASDE